MAHLIEKIIHILLVMVNVLTELSESSTVNNDNNGKSTSIRSSVKCKNPSIKDRLYKLGRSICFVILICTSNC